MMISTTLAQGIQWVFAMGVVPLAVAALSLFLFVRNIARFKLNKGSGSEKRLSLWTFLCHFFWPVVLFFLFDQADLLNDGRAHRYLVLTWFLGPAAHTLLIVALVGSTAFVDAFAPWRSKKNSSPEPAKLHPGKMFLIMMIAPAVAAVVFYFGDAMFKPCPTDWTGRKCRGVDGILGLKQNKLGSFFLTYAVMWLFAIVSGTLLYRLTSDFLERMKTHP